MNPIIVRDAAELVSYAWRPKTIPARDQRYLELVTCYRRDSEFAEITDALAAGLGLAVIEVTERAGIVASGDRESVFALRMGDYDRRAGSEHRAVDRILHGIIFLAIAAAAYPRPADLADDSYVGRISVEGVDAFVRDICDQLSTKTADVADPETLDDELEKSWHAYTRRYATSASKDGRRLSSSTLAMVAKATEFLCEQGFLTKRSDGLGGTYSTTARYQIQVRELAATSAYDQLLSLGIRPRLDNSGGIVTNSALSLEN